jgi:hypothetical protein
VARAPKIIPLFGCLIERLTDWYTGLSAEEAGTPPADPAGYDLSRTPADVKARLQQIVDTIPSTSGTPWTSSGATKQALRDAAFYSTRLLGSDNENP